MQPTTTQQTILLVNPPIHDFAAYDLFNKPLGLLYLASRLRRAGFHVALVDALDRNHRLLADRPDRPVTRNNGTGKYVTETLAKPESLAWVPRQYRRYGLGAGTLKTAITQAVAAIGRKNSIAAVLVGSMMTYWYPGVVEAVEAVRELLPGVPVALGGVYATLMPDHAQRVTGANRVFTGNAWPDLGDWLAQVTGNTVDTESAGELEHWPRPAYDLYETLDYLTLVTSLGCPFRCEYCASGLLQPRKMRISPETFASQVAGLIESLGPRLRTWGRGINVAMMDDALLARPVGERVELLDRLARLNLRWHTPNGLHCRFVGPEVAKSLYDSGFEMVRLSYETVESADRWVAASDHKVSDSAFWSAVEALRSAGYAPGRLEAYVLAGLPGQTVDEVRDSAQAVLSQGVRVRISQYTPIPGTAMFADACRWYAVGEEEPLLHNNTVLAEIENGQRCADRRCWQSMRDWVTTCNRAIAGK